MFERSPETFFQGFSFGLHYRFIEAVRGLSVLSENIRSRFGGHSSPGKSVDCESAVLVDKFRCLLCPRQDVLFSLGQMRPILRKNLPHVFVGDCQRRKSLRSAFRTSQSSGNVHIPLQGLTNSLVHDDCPFEALRELAKGYATEIRPFRNCSKSSCDMDEPSLE